MRDIGSTGGALEDCLGTLTAEQRNLIERYYSTESRTQMDARKALTEEFRISLNALRNRAMRIRADACKGPVYSCPAVACTEPRACVRGDAACDSVS